MERVKKLQQQCEVIANQLEELIEKAPFEGYDVYYLAFLKKQHKLYRDFADGLVNEIEREETLNERKAKGDVSQ